jgi:hypothetical protein
MHHGTHHGRRSAVAALAAAMLLALAACPLPQKPPPAVTVAGVYHARLPAADATARVVTLWLQPGGAASFETVFVGKGRGPVESGRWSATEDEVTVHLDGQSEPLVFGIAGARLVPRRWDRSLYGEAGLELTRRAAYNPERPGIFDTTNQPGRIEP